MDESRDVRLAAFAHDLRTPMCCVAGAAQMALDAEKQGKNVTKQLQEILRAVREMDVMIENMMKSGTSSAFTADMLTRELEAMCNAQAQKKQIKLNMDLTGAGSRWLKQDYGALVRILSNLIGNAMKYTPDGGEVCIRAQWIGAQRHGGWPHIRFVIADNGMGMKREFMKQMYMPYARAKESAHLPGKGMGLAIVHSLVKQMGGSIHVRSEWGRGTTFRVDVPVCIQEGMVN